MAGRELVFSNPEVVRLISTRFVPYAGDQWYLHRQKDADGEFFWKVVQQGYRRQAPMDQTRQGIYTALPDGELLGSDPYTPSLQRMLTLLNTSLERLAAKGEVGEVRIAASAADRNYQRVPPEGGLVLKVYTRIPLERKPDERWNANHATGRDHMWLTREEWRSLLPTRWARGESRPVPPAVAERLIRFHLVDNVRGEPPMWAREHIREQKLTLRVEDPATGRLHLEGLARVSSNDSSRGYDARLQGVLEVDRQADRFRRFDVLSWGDYWGHGPFTPRPPAGKFPLLVAFSLAGDRPADRVPPQGSREVQAYFGTGQ